MPVRKYRSVAEMAGPAGPAPLPPLDPANLVEAFGLMNLACRLFPIRYEPGVRKFRSFEEAIRARQERELEQIRLAHRPPGAGG